MSDVGEKLTRTDARQDLQEDDTESTERKPIQAKEHISKDMSSTPRDLTNIALHFLSTASNETLGACGVALAAGTYLVLGRVGLVLMGVAGGVILHATWDGTRSAIEANAARDVGNGKRREAGAEIARRLLDWTESRRGHSDIEDDYTAAGALDYSTFQPKTGAALTTLTDAVIRDYVKFVDSPSVCSYLTLVQMVVHTYNSHRRRISYLLSKDLDQLHTIVFESPLSQTSSRHVPRVLDQLFLNHNCFS